MKNLKKIKFEFKLERLIRVMVEILAVIIFYGVGCVLSKTYNYIAFLWMLLACIAFFLYYTILSRNLLDLRGILYAAITGSVALCQLRLSQIQIVWQTKTWILFIISLCSFSIGYYIFSLIRWNNTSQENSTDASKTFMKRFKFIFQPKRVYYATIFLAVMPIILFCIQAAIKGFIPIFVQRYDAYTLFYTKLSIFINLVIFSAPMAFWCLKNIELNIIQRVIMYAILPLPTIIFQLMVQRGLFVWSICILLVVVYLHSKRKGFGIVLVTVLLVFGVLFSSAMRNLSTSDMRQLWQMDEAIEIAPNNNIENNAPLELEPNNQAISIKIPGFVYAPYYYIINGTENFNHLVANLENNAWGLRQVSPFTVILRIPALKELIKGYPNYIILPNSTNILFGDFYYDFGSIGVFVEMLLVGLLCAIVQFFAKEKNSFFATLEYGVLFAVILTSFFAAWFSQFGTWLFAGTAFLIFLYVYLCKTDKKKIGE